MEKSQQENLKRNKNNQISQFLLFILLVFGQITVSQCSYNPDDRILKSVKLKDVAEYTVGQHYATDITSLGDNLMGLAYLGADANLYAMFIRHGEIVAESIKINDTLGDIQASAICEINKEAIMVVYTIHDAGSYQVYAKIVNKEGRFGTNANNQSEILVSHTTAVSTVGRCRQLSSSKIAISYGITLNHWDEYIRTYDIVSGAINTPVEINDTQTGAQAYGFTCEINGNRFIHVFGEYYNTSPKPGVYFQEIDGDGQKVGSNQFVAGSDVFYAALRTKIMRVSTGGFMMVWPKQILQSDFFEIWVARYVENGAGFDQYCIAAVGAGNQPDIENYKDTAYIIYLNGDYIKGIEVDLECKIQKYERIIDDKPMASPSTNQALNENDISVIMGVYYKLAGTPPSIHYTEYLIEQKKECNDKRCSGCYHDLDSCPLCVGSDQTDRSIRKRAEGDCSCIDGYYDDPSQLDCQKCGEKCQQCQGNADSCKFCINNTRYDPPTCGCAPGYYDDGNLECAQCDRTCLTCTDATACCKVGYYRTPQNKCEKCNLNCKTCQIDNKDICKSCSISTDLVDPVSGTCKACDSSCFGCVDRIDKCTSCESGKFLDEKNNLCLECDLTVCKSCEKTKTNCLICVNGQQPPYCAKIIAGYFAVVTDEDTLEYEKCDSKCEKCINKADQCQLCVDPNHREVSNDCQCKQGFKENKNGICEFIPCKSGFYKYGWECVQCYWIQGDDVCYEEGCPQEYYLEITTQECITNESSSVVMMVIFIVLSVLVIVFLIFQIIKKLTDQKQKQAQIPHQKLQNQNEIMGDNNNNNNNQDRQSYSIGVDAQNQKQNNNISINNDNDLNESVINLE